MYVCVCVCACMCVCMCVCVCVCVGTKVVVKRGEREDELLMEMIRTGKLRLCPKCKHPAMKDFGICNVIQCALCGTCVCMCVCACVCVCTH